MADAPKLDVLSIAAHPDDTEITCGGLLIKMVKRGRAVGALDLTRGEAGTHGDENSRASEAAAAAKVMGLAYRHNLQIEDAAVEYNQPNKLKIAEAIRATRPELVILPHWEQRHPDHNACSRLGYDACFLAGLKKLKIDGEPFRPRKIIYVSYFRNTDYSFLVDITDEFEQKCEAVAAYQSQFGSGTSFKDILKGTTNLYDLISTGGRNIFSPGINIYDLMHTRAHQLGQLAGVRYAEAYTIKERILIDDPQTMPVASV
ncbi:MAG: bacillithiol biosynthesis deacetylase BshB1 [Candidatus Zixiibacteriota bacterium]